MDCIDFCELFDYVNNLNIVKCQHNIIQSHNIVLHN